MFCFCCKKSQVIWGKEGENCRIHRQAEWWVNTRITTILFYCNGAQLLVSTLSIQFCQNYLFFLSSLLNISVNSVKECYIGVEDIYANPRTLSFPDLSEVRPSTVIYSKIIGKDQNHRIYLTKILGHFI